MRIRIRARPDLFPDLPNKPQRKRRRIGGRDIAPKNPASAKNSRSKKVVVSPHGRALKKRIMNGDFDMRSVIGQAYVANKSELTAHIGGEPSAPQARLIDMAARLRLIAEISWSELRREGAFRNGEPRPALDVFRRVTADERSILVLLGIQRRSRELTLGDLLAEEQQQ